MRPDEWQKGMQNEAASVEDAAWARETRRTALLRLLLPVALVIGVWAMATAAFSLVESFSSLHGLPSRTVMSLQSLVYPGINVAAAWWLTRKNAPVAALLLVPLLGTLLALLAGQVITVPFQRVPDSGGIPGITDDLLPGFSALRDIYAEPVGMIVTSLHTILALLAGKGLAGITRPNWNART